MIDTVKPTQKRKRVYASATEITRVIQVARDNGIDVNTVEVAPSGTIAVREQKATQGDPKASEFDRWNDEGRL